MYFKPSYFKHWLINSENYGEHRKQRYDEIRNKYGLKPDSENPFDGMEDEPEETKPKSFFSKLKKSVKNK